MELNNLQQSILDLFKAEFFDKSIEIVDQKTRISFKNGRLNYFILYPRKGIFTFHLNLRQYKIETLPLGFNNTCFNQAIRYIEKDITSEADANEMIVLVENFTKIQP